MKALHIIKENDTYLSRTTFLALDWMSQDAGRAGCWLTAVSYPSQGLALRQSRGLSGPGHLHDIAVEAKARGLLTHDSSAPKGPGASAEDFIAQLPSWFLPLPLLWPSVPAPCPQSALAHTSPPQTALSRNPDSPGFEPPQPAAGFPCFQHLQISLPVFWAQLCCEKLFWHILSNISTCLWLQKASVLAQSAGFLETSLLSTCSISLDSVFPLLFHYLALHHILFQDSSFSQLTLTPFLLFGTVLCLLISFTNLSLYSLILILFFFSYLCLYFIYKYFMLSFQFLILVFKV